MFKYIFIFAVYSILLYYHSKWRGYKLGYKDCEQDCICKECRGLYSCKKPINHKDQCKWEP